MSRRTPPRAAAFALFLCLAAPAASAETPAGAKKPYPGSVQVMFLPPPSEEAVYSVGVYETTTGRLVRRLFEDAEDGAFTAGLNGFITFWDRKDDAGKIVPAGKYAARGWAVSEMKVEGVDILGNGWADEDEDLRVCRVEAVGLSAAGDYVVTLVTTPGDTLDLLCLRAVDGGVTWRQDVTAGLASSPSDLKRPFVLQGRADQIELTDAGGGIHTWRLADGSKAGGGILNAPIRPSPTEALSPDGSVWKVDPQGLRQVSATGVILRELSPTPGQPTPRAVAVAGTKLMVLEETEGWQRVRGLEWSETKPGADGRPVSEWKTFFERSIRRPDPALGLDEKAPSPGVEFPLAKNPLEPGKPQRAKLRAGFDAKGSHLETADGLRLLPVSARPHLRAARLVRDPQDPGRLLFYQFDGAAWDVFSVSGVSKALVGFDAGEFELSADGERRPPPPADEPRDL